MNPAETPFWRLYHRLLDWADEDGLPDPDRVDAAHWMMELHETLKVACDDRTCRLALDAINAGRPRIYPLGATP